MQLPTTPIKAILPQGLYLTPCVIVLSIHFACMLHAHCKMNHMHFIIIDPYIPKRWSAAKKSLLNPNENSKVVDTFWTITNLHSSRPVGYT